MIMMVSSINQNIIFEFLKLLCIAKVVVLDESLKYMYHTL